MPLRQDGLRPPAVRHPARVVARVGHRAGLREWPLRVGEAAAVGHQLGQPEQGIELVVVIARRPRRVEPRGQRLLLVDGGAALRVDHREQHERVGHAPR